MKIAFLTERMILGFGVDLVVDNIAKGLADIGHDITVFAINVDGSYENRNYKIEQIPCPLIWNPIKQELKAREFFPYIKKLENDFELFIIETFPFFQYVCFLNIPTIIVDYGVPSTKGMNWKTKIRLNYEMITKNYIHYRHVDQIIAISQYLQSKLPGFAKKKSTVISCGSNHYYLEIKNDQNKKDKKFKKSLGINKNDKLLLYVGRLNYKDQPYKGVNDLLEIYKEIRSKNNKIYLLMVGYGDNKDKKYLEDMGAKVILKAPANMMPTIYSSCDICVSASKWEGFDLPIAEANSFGKPSVCYDIGAHKEVIENGKSGYTVKNKNEFIEKTLKLISDNRVYEEMSRNAFLVSKKFIWKNIVKKYEEIAEKTIKKSNKKNYEKGLVNIITLNYNGKKYLDQLFESLKSQTYKKINITMVDNGSKDDSVEYIKKNHKEVNVITSNKNLFFSTANNIAINQTNGEFILLLNNDIVVDKNAVAEMVKTIKKDSKTAAAVPKIMFLFNKKIFDSFGTAIMPDGSPFNRGIGQYDIGQYDLEEKVFGACFGAVLIKRDIYKNMVGPLDNDYYGYFEDVDWCYRANGMGLNFITSPKAVVYHNHSGTSKNMGNEWKYFLIHRNYLRTLFKNYGNRNLLKYYPLRLIGYIKQVIRPPFKDRRATSIKILFDTLIYFPKLIFKRFNVRKLRIKSFSDEMIWSFSHNQKQFFDSEKYEVQDTLENIRFSYEEKYIRLHNLEISDFNKLQTMKTLMRLNELYNNYKTIGKDRKKELISEIEKDLVVDIGEKDGEKYSKILRKTKT